MNSFINNLAAALQPSAQFQTPAEKSLGMTEGLLKESLEEFEEKYLRLEQFRRSEPEDYSEWWLCISHDKMNKASGPEELETLKRELKMVNICRRGNDDAFRKLGTEVRRLRHWKNGRLPNVEESFGEIAVHDPSAYTMYNLGIPLTLRQLERKRKEYMPIEFISYIFLELGQALKDLKNLNGRKVALNGFKSRDVLLYPSETMVPAFPAVIITKCDDFRADPPFDNLQTDISFDASRQKDTKAFCTIVYELLKSEGGKDAVRFKNYAAFQKALEDASKSNVPAALDKTLDVILKQHSPAAQECLKNITDVMKLKVITEILNVRNNYAASNVDGKLRDAIQEAKGRPATNDTKA